jgi:hypothetical protein
MPAITTLHDAVKRLDVPAFEAILQDQDWAAQPVGAADRRLQECGESAPAHTYGESGTTGGVVRRTGVCLVREWEGAEWHKEDSAWTTGSKSWTTDSKRLKRSI